MNITFEKGLIGLEEYKDYIIEDIEDNEYFKILRSCDEKDFSIVVTSPFYVDEKYEIDLSEEVVNRLSIISEKDVLIYTTVTVNSDMRKATTNFRAPIIINTKNNLAEQVILDKDKYMIKQPLMKG
ncbi:flagellar assembly protein FliW [Clostridium sp. MSJ-8]|uniref:flagellar assembly protein FliW n=1 Tax=Clostridium sp. MSJ-8 TaxID=2841510 RepID=UPI001C0EFDBE|nr:flagellar assembly protein FliW [Clostridium sp. MSJ-8]MBU5488441.1 flagellar assembly protein FliW [Clostridium sp. MSJ-8]